MQVRIMSSCSLSAATANYVFLLALEVARAMLGSEESLDTLVVAGISAGAIGVLNHFDEIRTTAQSAKVVSLRLLLDSAMISDDLDEYGELDELASDYVDTDLHPYCDQEFTATFHSEELSTLPCCLSVQCMLKYHSTLQLF